MEIIGIITSVIATLVAIVALLFSIRSSKSHILTAIDRKERKVKNIEMELVRQFGLNRPFHGYGPITPLDEKRSKLLAEIYELKRRL